MSDSTPQRPRRPVRSEGAAPLEQGVEQDSAPEVQVEPSPEHEGADDAAETMGISDEDLGSQPESPLVEESTSAASKEIEPETEASPYLQLPQSTVVSDEIETEGIADDLSSTPEVDADEHLEPLPTKKSNSKFFLRNDKKASPEGVKGVQKQRRRWSPRTKSLIITGATLTVIFGMFGFSLYQVSQAPSREDMTAVYIERSGDQGFPIERGENVAERYLSLYLTADPDPNVRRQTEDTLEAMMVNGKPPSWPGEITQRIISGPTPAGLLIQESAIKASQRYTAVIETTQTVEQPGSFGEEQPEPEVTKEVSTVTYLVNLEADPETFEVAVRGNPTLLPNRPAVKLPTAQGETTDGPLGSEINQALITPFLQAWAASDAPVIQKFLSNSANGPWVQGLGGAQVLRNASVSAPTSLKSTREGPIQVEVQWETPFGAQQTSNYTMTVVFENGGWLLKDLY